MKFTAGICTLGCKVNFYESECIAAKLEKLGVEMLGFDRVCDIYIINSCTVTAESDRKVTQMCRRAVARNPEALVCVTGCMAQVDPKRLAAIPGVAFVCGNKEKGAVVRRVAEYIQTCEARGSKSANSEAASEPEISVPAFSKNDAYEPLALIKTAHTRAIVKIEDGCNSACTYCIIHTARGPARSRAEADILSEIRRLADSGYREVVLTGIELSSYSGDLGALVQHAGEIPGIERIRLGSLDPYYIKPELTAKLAECPQLMPHFHISLQSGSDKTLRAMHRKYTSARARANILCLRDHFPSACFFADIIVGFPGETEEDFEDTVNFIKDIGFLHLHIFPYSRRAGTPAASMPDQVPQAVKRERAARLAAIQAEIKKEFLEGIVSSGRHLKVLAEADLSGHSEEFIEVKFACGGSGAEEAMPVQGCIYDCIPVSTDGDTLTAVISGS